MIIKMADTQRARFIRTFFPKVDWPFQWMLYLIAFIFTLLCFRCTNSSLWKEAKGFLSLVWRSNFWMKINWVFIRSHLNHHIWSPFVFLSSTSCHPSTYPRLAHRNQQTATQLSTDPFTTQLSQQSPSQPTLLSTSSNPTQISTCIICWVSPESGEAHTSAHLPRAELPALPVLVSAQTPNLPSWLQLQLYHPFTRWKYRLAFVTQHSFARRIRGPAPWCAWS